MVLSNFVERLKEFMLLKNVNATDLSKETGVDRSTISGILRMDNAPSMKVFCTFVAYFNCSADYLLGLKDDYPENKRFTPRLDGFGERLYAVLKKTGTSQYELTKYEKISGNLLYRWLHDLSQPGVYNLVKLAKYMDVSVDLLLGIER